MSYVLGICTDIHLNFLKFVQLEEFCDRIKNAGHKLDGLLITGDIAEAPTLKDLLEFVSLKIQIPIFYVLGNHDYYGDSIYNVRKKIVPSIRQKYPLTYLPNASPIHLTSSTVLVGVDGWADGLFGDAIGSRVGLADWQFISDLRQARAGGHLLATLKALGHDEASALEVQLKEAVKIPAVKEIIIATHVPPWVEAAWHMGKHSDEDWLPWFSCKQVGEVIERIASAHPDLKFEVFTGHTHGKGQSQIASNLIVTTNEAEYGAPKLNMIVELS